MQTQAIVSRIGHEGLNSFDSFLDFDEKSIVALQKACKEDVPAIVADAANNVTAQAAIPGVSIPSKCILRLIEAVHCAHYYKAVGRSFTSDRLHYDNVLAAFKIERQAYEAMKEDQAEPKVSLVNDKDGDRRIINWIAAFQDHCNMCFGAYGPLAYVIRDNATVEPEAQDPLDATSYYGKSGSLAQELVNRIKHNGPIYKSDNGRVFMKICEAVKGTSCESTVKAFTRTKDGRGAYLALISNHAGEVKYRSLLKSSMNYLQNVKWSGNQFPFESHVSKHRKAHDQIVECSTHIACQIISAEQKVEYLLDSITSNDNTIQATLALIRSNPVLRADFEQAASNLIEIDPFKKNRGNGTGKRPHYNISDASGIAFQGGRGESGVDLRWHSRKEFNKLTSAQKDELNSWLKTSRDGKECKKKAILKMKDAQKTRDDKEKHSKRAKKYHKKVEENLREVFAVLLKDNKSKSDSDDDSQKKDHKSSESVAANLASAVATGTNLKSILKNGNIFKKV